MGPHTFFYYKLSVVAAVISLLLIMLSFTSPEFFEMLASIFTPLFSWYDWCIVSLAILLSFQPLLKGKSLSAHDQIFANKFMFFTHCGRWLVTLAAYMVVDSIIRWIYGFDPSHDISPFLSWCVLTLGFVIALVLHTLQERYTSRNC